MTLDAHLSAPVSIDICTACQAFWFDKYESLKLSAGSTLKLMKLIGEHSTPAAGSLSEAMKCPRCSNTLLFTHDMQRSTRFTYWRCGNEHGRFIRFFEFLKEKNFIRPLTAKQIEELRQNLQSVNCSNCGAPIDLQTSSSCSHCGSALSMLDMSQPKQLLDELQSAAIPLKLTQVKLEAEPQWWNEASSSSLVHAGLGAVLRWLISSGI